MEYPYKTDDDAFLMMINNVAIPVWFTSLSLSNQEDDAITAMTVVSITPSAVTYTYIYAFLTTLDTDFTQRQSAFLKVDASNGLVITQIVLNLRSSTSGAFYFQELRHMNSLSSTTTYDGDLAFSATFTYQTSVATK